MSFASLLSGYTKSKTEPPPVAKSQNITKPKHRLYESLRKIRYITCSSCM